MQAIKHAITIYYGRRSALIARYSSFNVKKIQCGIIIAHSATIMEPEKILILDEDGFSRVCAAILAAEGYAAERVSAVSDPAVSEKVRLVIASYPFAARFCPDVRKMSIPVIVLTDHISSDLLAFLGGLELSYCLMKPLNFEKFVMLVKNLMSGAEIGSGGYSIV